MKPIAVAPRLTASLASSARVMPQIFTITPPLLGRAGRASVAPGSGVVINRSPMRKPL